MEAAEEFQRRLLLIAAADGEVAAWPQWRPSMVRVLQGARRAGDAATVSMARSEPGAELVTPVRFELRRPCMHRAAITAARAGSAGAFLILSTRCGAPTTTCAKLRRGMRCGRS
jgi:hypothetical protein